MLVIELKIMTAPTGSVTRKIKYIGWSINNIYHDSGQQQQRRYDNLPLRAIQASQATLRSLTAELMVILLIGLIGCQTKILDSNNVNLEVWA